MHSSIDKCHCYDTVCEQNCIHFVFLNFNLLPEINMIKAHLHVLHLIMQLLSYKFNLYLTYMQT